MEDRVRPAGLFFGQTEIIQYTLDHVRVSKTANVRTGNRVAVHYLQERGQLNNYVNNVVDIDLSGRYVRSCTTICVFLFHLVLKLVANNTSQVLKSKFVDHRTILINILRQS